MIKGIGIDIVELKRIEALCRRQPRFPRRILTAAEFQEYEKRSGRRSLEFLTGRFAAKEAYAKARGCGIGRKLSFQDIEVLTGTFGRPEFRHVVEKNGMFDRKEQIHLSISHSQQYVVAEVIIEGTSGQYA